jgi:hypothetical protein
MKFDPMKPAPPVTRIVFCMSGIFSVALKMVSRSCLLAGSLSSRTPIDCNRKGADQACPFAENIQIYAAFIYAVTGASDASRSASSTPAREGPNAMRTAPSTASSLTPFSRTILS